MILLGKSYIVFSIPKGYAITPEQVRWMTETPEAIFARCLKIPIWSRKETGLDYLSYRCGEIRGRLTERNCNRSSSWLKWHSSSGPGLNELNPETTERSFIGSEHRGSSIAIPDALIHLACKFAHNLPDPKISPKPTH